MIKGSQANSAALLKSDRNLWNIAISKAEEILRKHEAVISRLKHSIKSFEEFRDSGIEFPRTRRGRPPKGY